MSGSEADSCVRKRFHVPCSQLRRPPKAKMKSPDPTALGDRKSPAEAGLSDGGDPKYAKLEPTFRFHRRVGRASDVRGVRLSVRESSSLGSIIVAET